MKKITINKIRKEKYKGLVYNLEVGSLTKDDSDDKFWIEQETGIVTHNCFPKDLNALITTMKENGIDPLILEAVWEQNKRVRKDWDWANNSSAVSGEENASS